MGTRLRAGPVRRGSGQPPAPLSTGSARGVATALFGTPTSRLRAGPGDRKARGAFDAPNACVRPSSRRKDRVMIAQPRQVADPEIQAALSELQDLVRARYPDA